MKIYKLLVYSALTYVPLAYACYLLGGSPADCFWVSLAAGCLLGAVVNLDDEEAQ